MKTVHDEKMIRCPKLGDEMKFSYCLREDVTDVLNRVLTPDQWARFISAKPKEKALSLIELIEKAKAKK